MPDNSHDATGTELFLSLDGTTVLKFDCPTAINGIGFTSAKVPNGCLDDTADTSRPGKKTINDITVPYNVQANSEAHEYLLNLVNNPTEELPYAIGWSDGTDDPTIASGEFVAPGVDPAFTRTVTHGTGYVLSNNVDINNGSIYSGSFTFAPQSQVTTFKPAA